MDHEPGLTISNRPTSTAVAETAAKARGKKRLRGQRMVNTTKHPASTRAHPRSKYQRPPRAGSPTATRKANMAAAAADNLRKPNTIVSARNGKATNTLGLVDTENISVMNRRPAALGQVRSSATAPHFFNRPQTS
jgi:hypothetical protein